MPNPMPNPYQDAVHMGSREGAVRASCATLGAQHVRLNAPMCETQRQGWLATVEWATELEPDHAALLVRNGIEP